MNFKCIIEVKEASLKILPAKWFHLSNILGKAK